MLAGEKFTPGRFDESVSTAVRMGGWETRRGQSARVAGYSLPERMMEKISHNPSRVAMI